MSRIKSRDTKIELTVRRELHSRGFRYRLGGAGLPGSPDLVLPKYKTVIYVHGCFWHGHDCHLFRLPRTRPEFWENKINGNRVRDQRVKKEIQRLGWTPLDIWECSIRGAKNEELSEVFDALALRIRG
jgi:DNA mismatch endonuclease (patch repair protein)